MTKSRLIGAARRGPRVARGGPSVVGIGGMVACALFAAGPAPLDAMVASGAIGPGRLLLQVQTPDQDTIPAPPAPVPEELPPDTLEAEPEFRVRNLPEFAPGPPSGWARGVWEWDRDGLRSTRAITVLELLEQVPGVIPLRGGDHGQPAAASAFGVGGGRIRVYWDGVEMAPLDGGAVDLSRVGIAALERVRVERGPGELRIELVPLTFSDPRPYSFIEVGAGDLNTNLFRGVFAHPDALGGSIVLALDRLDTAGTLRQEPGVSFGGQIRYNLFFGERLGVAWEFRRMTSRRPSDLWELGGIQRTDWGVRSRYEIAPGVVAGLAFQRASVSPDSDEDDSGGQGPDGDEMEALLPRDPRTQLVARLAMVREGWWAEAEHRQHWGDGWPSSVQALRAGGSVPGIGGASVSVERAAWDAESPLAVHARAWSRPVRGFSAFAELEDGRRGVPFRILPEPEPEEGEDEEPEPPPDPASFTDRTGVRAGLEYRRGDLMLGGAFLSVEADSLHPTGLPPDREGAVVPGGERTGFEVSGHVPLGRVLDGLALRGSVQLWDEAETWRYLPRHTYDGSVSFHDVFLESENLEVWADVGVAGRDGMSVPVTADGAGLGTVPFYQSWFGRLQIRVVSVRAFLRWENFTLRPANQDFPDRILPQTRVMYGIRWTMWN